MKTLTKLFVSFLDETMQTTPTKLFVSFFDETITLQFFDLIWFTSIDSIDSIFIILQNKNEIEKQEGRALHSNRTELALLLGELQVTWKLLQEVHHHAKNINSRFSGESPKSWTCRAFNKDISDDPFEMVMKRAWLFQVFPCLFWFRFVFSGYLLRFAHYQILHVDSIRMRKKGVATIFFLMKIACHHLSHPPLLIHSIVTTRPTFLT
jgi:hypothetical protein